MFTIPAQSPEPPPDHRSTVMVNDGVETPFNRPPRNDVNVVRKEMYMFNSSGHKLGKVEILELDGKSLAQARHYVSLLQEENGDKEVLSIAIGPNIAVKKYKGFITNGYRFLTRQREEFKKTQNSGAMCDWVDNRLYRGLKNDKYGFPLVIFSRPLVHTGENFKDLKDVGWSHVIMTKPRDIYIYIYDMGTNVNRDDDDSYTQCMPCNLPIMHDVNQEPRWRHRDTELQDA
ncbi:hypothetical protein Tco_0115171 [Tanacetum coccineum]